MCSYPPPIQSGIDSSMLESSFPHCLLPNTAGIRYPPGPPLLACRTLHLHMLVTHCISQSTLSLTAPCAPRHALGSLLFPRVSFPLTRHESATFQKTKTHVRWWHGMRAATLFCGQQSATMLRGEKGQVTWQTFRNPFSERCVQDLRLIHQGENLHTSTMEK